MKDCLKINDIQRITRLEKGKIYILNSNIKSPFTIYADFESLLVPEDKGKQNLEES